jgi:hypothetical protein
MAKTVLAFGKIPRCRKLAEEVIKAQEGEIVLRRSGSKRPANKSSLTSRRWDGACCPTGCLSAPHLESWFSIERGHGPKNLRAMPDRRMSDANE